MAGKFSVSVIGILVGIFFGFFIIRYAQFFLPKNNTTVNRISSFLGLENHQVIGFLPYWLISKATRDYTKDITTLTYFGLTISPDGTIKKLSQPGEEDPGWRTLHAGLVNPFFQTAKKNNIQLSLLIFSGNEDTIGQLVADPVTHADNLINEVFPIMKQYGFSDLNLDIESVKIASDSARENFTTFVKEVKKKLDQQNLGTLTVDASPIVLIKNYLINLWDISQQADSIVLMTYDFHYPGSFVTGPVAPIGGGGVDSEYDTKISILEALNVIPADKILLGLPLYGYEWETIGNSPRSAVLPASGIVASNARVEDLLKNCASCSAQIDPSAQESYLVYKDTETGTYHQIFYPDVTETSKKIELVNQYNLGGVALWALGYEGDTILNPVAAYRSFN